METDQRAAPKHFFLIHEKLAGKFPREVRVIAQRHGFKLAHGPDRPVVAHSEVWYKTLFSGGVCVIRLDGDTVSEDFSGVQPHCHKEWLSSRADLALPSQRYRSAAWTYSDEGECLGHAATEEEVQHDGPRIPLRSN